MSILLFKTTLLRSNPQIIREFFIRDSLTLGDLLDVLFMVHGWENRETMEVSFAPVEGISENENTGIELGKIKSSGKELGNGKSSTALNPETSLRDMLFSGVRMWTLEIPMEVPKVYYYSWQPRKESTRQYWRFRLELTGKYPWDFMRKSNLLDEESFQKGEDAFRAMLVRASYFQPWQNTSSMKDSNLMLEKINRMECYRTDDGNTVWKDALLVDLEQINRDLSPNLGEACKKVRIRHDLGLPLNRILENNTASDIKYMIQWHSLGLTYNQKKAQLIKNLVGFMNGPEFWERLLKEMDYAEYMRFYQYVLDNRIYQKVRIKDFPVLGGYLLLKEDYDFLRFPEEFLRYYEKRMGSQGDDDLLDTKRMAATLFLARQLYGIIRKEVFRKLYQTLWKEDYNEVDFERRWEAEYRASLGRSYFDFDSEWRSLNAQTLYWSEDFAENDAKRLYSKISNYSVSAYYMPKKEEALEAAEKGLNFPDDVYRRLYQLVESHNHFYYGYIPVSDILQFIYYACQMQKSLDKMETDLHWDYHFILSGEEKKKFRELIKEARKCVRRYDLLGFTEYEWQKKRKTDARR